MWRAFLHRNSGYNPAMVTINGRYEGGLRCGATHGPSQAALITDAPVDNHGQGRSFSPTDLLATALGTCMLTIMGIWAQRHEVDLVGTTFVTTKEMTATPPRRVARLTVTFDVPARLTPEQQQRLEQAALTCPVHQSLHPDVKIELKFNWA